VGFTGIDCVKFLGAVRKLAEHRRPEVLKIALTEVRNCERYRSGTMAGVRF